MDYLGWVYGLSLSGLLFLNTGRLGSGFVVGVFRVGLRLVTRVYLIFQVGLPRGWFKIH